MARVELLAPAGSYDGLMGAISAGADAVYLGGEKFGARAYADNFTARELVRAIDYVHLHGRKLYLTINTLVKEKEFSELYEYLAPLYERGLDGVIVQDVGVMAWIGRQFPLIPIHASTQMNITHAYGAVFLKKHGVSRVIPARELSLEELRELGKMSGMGLEAFVHGAMCYSYSGQCLFSSILGGRSGNRGRCAQPCRLPYELFMSCHEGEQKAAPHHDSRECYPLSMKDICTIERIPELIQAGISSFKIEGRMKKPEYAAGVTAMYRKYIDLYYKTKGEGYEVRETDKQFLMSLYIRSEIGEGYYFRHNGREMLSMAQSGYIGSDEHIINKIREKHLKAAKSVRIKGSGYFRPGEKARLTLFTNDYRVAVNGSIVERANNQPLTEEMVMKQLLKSGNTPYELKEVLLDMTDDVYMNVKEINQLRRQALSLMEEEMLKQYRRPAPPRERQLIPESVTIVAAPAKEPSEAAEQPEAAEQSETAELAEATEHAEAAEQPEAKEQPPEYQKLHILVKTKEQWQSGISSRVKRIYADIDLWNGMYEGLVKCEEQEWFAVLPRIFRQRTEQYLCRYQEIIQDVRCDGVLVPNLESLEWLQECGYEGPIVTDTSLYAWNREAVSFWRERAGECYLPLELNQHELYDLTAALGMSVSAGIQIYGRIPMMVSANCAGKTFSRCAGQPEKDVLLLRDRYHKDFPVLQSCEHCYNVIYNTVPLSLHAALEQGKLAGFHSLRLDFTTEGGEETTKLIDFFGRIISLGRPDAETVSQAGPVKYAGGIKPDFQAEAALLFKRQGYTTGHYKRGVE